MAFLEELKVGRANVILDNLIAQGKAKPMLVVMPLGYGAPEVLLPNSGVFRDPSLTQRNFDNSRKALLTEVLPHVEAAYPVIKDHNSRAIAGLSMGGADSRRTPANRKYWCDRVSWNYFRMLVNRLETFFPSMSPKKRYSK